MRVRSGQVVLYLVVVLVAITILMLSNVGTFLAVRAKNHAMNAVDAAAIAAARRQGELLNEIGRLNLRHAEADWRELCKPPDERDWSESQAIVRQQRRIAFLGPVDCLRAANEAAEANGAKSNAKMTSILRLHVSYIHSKYIPNPDIFPPPWDGAWVEYASAISSIADNGVFAGCDNIDFVDAAVGGEFPLLNKTFYDVVESESWCKFVHGGPKWRQLLDCDSHNMPRPEPDEANPYGIVNSEFCSLHLYFDDLPYNMVDEDFRDFMSRNGASLPPPGARMYKDERRPDDPSRKYSFYDLRYWREWVELDPESNFPIIGRVKPEFNVLGCTSAFRTIETMPRILSGDSRDVAYTAAAKPFGTIMTANGVSSVIEDCSFGVVLPSYEAVRLIPYDAANRDGQNLSTADSEWLDHVREHVPYYCANGIDGLPVSCRYCKSLKKWENPDFRSRAAAWIAANAESCLRGKGGPGPTGGTSYAH